MYQSFNRRTLYHEFIVSFISSLCKSTDIFYILCIFHDEVCPYLSTKYLVFQYVAWSWAMSMSLKSRWRDPNEDGAVWNDGGSHLDAWYWPNFQAFSLHPLAHSWQSHLVGKCYRKVDQFSPRILRGKSWSVWQQDSSWTVTSQWGCRIDQDATHGDGETAGRWRRLRWLLKASI